jgi:hypothetical protein
MTLDFEFVLVEFFPYNVQVMVKLSLCFSPIPCEDMWGKVSKAPCFLKFDSSWRLVVSFMLHPLYSRERAHGTCWVTGWVGPSTSLGAVVRVLTLVIHLLRQSPYQHELSWREFCKLFFPFLNMV